MRQAHNTIWSKRQQNRDSNSVEVPEALGALDRFQKQPQPRATHSPTLQRQGASGEGTHTSVAILKSRQCLPLPILQSQEPSLNPSPTSSPCPREQAAGRAAAAGKEFLAYKELTARPGYFWREFPYVHNSYLTHTPSYPQHPLQSRP